MYFLPTCIFSKCTLIENKLFICNCFIILQLQNFLGVYDSAIHCLKCISSKKTTVFFFFLKGGSRHVFWIAFELYLLFSCLENELQQFATMSHPAKVIALVIDQELLW